MMFVTSLAMGVPVVSRRRPKSGHAPEDYSPGVTPKTQKQREYLSALQVNDQVICYGPAGTGKTYVAAAYAAGLYDKARISKIVVTRPHVSVGKGLGFLPGDMLEKTIPWAIPVLEVFNRQLGKGKVDSAIRNNNIEIAPLATMRGRSFEESFIIVDEAQNLTVEEAKMLLTRVGDGSRIVLNGDIQQSDLKVSSGLSVITRLAEKYGIPVPIIEFTLDDIVRSDICKQWVTAFYKENL